MIHNKESHLVSSKIVSTLQSLNEWGFHTLTLDNGLEFAAHQMISNKLGKKVYFADPYSPWQRGCNENINGLVRQYLPKGMDFSNLTPQKLYFIQEKLNHRPRNKLGYRTPYEVFYGNFALNSWIQQSHNMRFMVFSLLGLIVDFQRNIIILDYPKAFRIFLSKTLTIIEIYRWSVDSLTCMCSGRQKVIIKVQRIHP